MQLMNYPDKVVIGIMSGTSLDGLDIAACRFKADKDGFQYELLAAETYSYTPELKNKLASLMQGSALDFVKTDSEFGYLIGTHINGFVQKYDIQADLVASHGHTIFHQPQNGFTTQIGNGSCISSQCGLPVVYDFRMLDVAMGGQGAPLVPIGDQLLFASYSHCLNLGGIANISYDGGKGQRLAYDICPVNIVLNILVSEIGLDYDKDGALAAKGKTDQELLQQLESLDFYKQKGPKSMGREWIDEVVLPLILKRKMPLEDKLNTFCHHIGMCIAAEVSGKETNKILVSGGGAFNKYLVECIRKYTKGKAEVVVPDDAGIISFKEAIIFAFLGYRRLLGLPNCLASVTGAKADMSGGAVVGI
jgi:anhydro-N-acetylmuramic acid kinase